MLPYSWIESWVRNSQICSLAVCKSVIHPIWVKRKNSLFITLQSVSRKNVMTCVVFIKANYYWFSTEMTPYSRLHLRYTSTFSANWTHHVCLPVLGNTVLEVAGVVLPLLTSLLILYSRELLLYLIFYSETRYSTRILLKSIEKF